MMKKIGLLLFLLTQSVFSLHAEPDLGLAGEVKAFVLMDAKSHRVLAHYRATEKLNPASITKLMTAYTIYNAIDKGLLRLEDKTTISQNARNMEEGSRMFLERGSRVSIDNLLHGLIIQSGNDAAVALAEALAGSEQSFVRLMNRYAKSLGMHHSHFKNVIGFTEEGHFMSAYDIAILASAIIKKFPEHYKLYKQKAFTWDKITQQNRNGLLAEDPSVDGLKTGHTEAAGYCLTSSAKRGNMRLIAVVLGAKSTNARVSISKRLLNFGFARFRETRLLKKGKKMATRAVSYGDKKRVDIAPSQSLTLPIAKTGKASLRAQLVLKKAIEAPVKKGQVVGDFVIKEGQTVIVSVPAVAMKGVAKAGFFRYWWQKLFN